MSTVFFGNIISPAMPGISEPATISWEVMLINSPMALAMNLVGKVVKVAHALAWGSAELTIGVTVALIAIDDKQEVLLILGPVMTPTNATMLPVKGGAESNFVNYLIACINAIESASNGLSAGKTGVTVGGGIAPLVPPGVTPPLGGMAVTTGGLNNIITAMTAMNLISQGVINMAANGAMTILATGALNIISGATMLSLTAAGLVVTTGSTAFSIGPDGIKQTAPMSMSSFSGIENTIAGMVQT